MMIIIIIKIRTIFIHEKSGTGVCQQIIEMEHNLRISKRKDPDNPIGKLTLVKWRESGVADPWCLFQIWIFSTSDPGSGFSIPISDPDPQHWIDKKFRHFLPKNCYSALGNMIRDVTPDPDPQHCESLWMSIFSKAGWVLLNQIFQ
jgi:hypothetical protein